jgi:hypothetical protein
LIFPFSEGMLMTGTAYDAIGAEKAAITSDWTLLAEVFGDAAIHYGSTREDLTRCLESLTADRIAASKRAMRQCREQSEWHDIAAATLELFEEAASSVSLPPATRQRD